MPVSGSTWVEGTYLKWIDSTGVTKSMQGLSLGVVAGAVRGSIWVQGEDVHYIDETTGTRRYCTSVDRGLIAVAIKGSTWIEAYTHNIGGAGRRTPVNNNTEDTIHIISESNKKRALHQDAVHNDAYSHNDSSYMHNDYYYMHNDYTYMHSDTAYPHEDQSTYTHNDGTLHGDGQLHSDGTSPHTDSYMHGDYISPTGQHGDEGARGTPPHVDGGGARYNSYYMHNDYSYMHSDSQQVRTHADYAPWHNDVAMRSSSPYHYSGSYHSDATPHSDAPHTDSPN